jgi:two-component system chemotaxis sensor kinase CheA
MEKDLLTLEKCGADTDEDLVNRIFRTVNTVRGGARFFDLDKFGELAYVMESLLDRIREREFVPDHETVHALLEGSDLLYKVALDPDCLLNMDFTKAKEKIETVLNQNLTRSEKTSQKETINVTLEDGRIVFSISKYDFDRAIKAERGGSNFYLLEYDLMHDVENQGLTPWEVLSELLKTTFFIESRIDMEGLGPLGQSAATSIPFYALISTILDTDLINEVVHIDPSRIYRVKEDGTAYKMSEMDKKPKTAPKRKKRKAEAKAKPAGIESKSLLSEEEIAKINGLNGQSKDSGTSSPNNTVQVDADLLDELKSLTDELDLIRNQLVQESNACNSSEVKSAVQRMDDITTEMQEVVMATRI